MPVRVLLSRDVSGQFGQRSFGAHVMRFDPLQIFFRLNRRRDGQKAIETAGIEGSVLVLRSAIHTFDPAALEQQGFSIVRILLNESP